MSRYLRLRGLTHLILDVTLHGGRAVERIQLETVGRVFRVLEKVPALGLPSSVAHAAYDLSVKGTHQAIEVVNRGVRVAIDLALDVAEANVASPRLRDGESSAQGEPSAAESVPGDTDPQAREVPSRP